MVFKRLWPFFYTMTQDRFSTEQKKIALALVNGPLTMDEIKQQSRLAQDSLSTAIKEMVALRLIEKQDGFPTRFALKAEIADELVRRKQLAETDSNKIRLRAIIEGQAFEPDLLNKQMRKLSDALAVEPGIVVYGSTMAPTLKQDESYSTFLDVTLTIQDFKTLVRFMYFYGPATIEVLKPSTLQIDAHDLQEALLDMAQMIHKYSDYVTKLLNRTELEEFNRRLVK